MEKSLVNHEPEAMWKEIVVAWFDMQPAICPIRMDCSDLKPQTVYDKEEYYSLNRDVRCTVNVTP
jgi:hypothetical protein